MTKPAIWAAAICVVAASLESLATGRGVKSRLVQLRQPPHSPPLAVWIAIGLGYYLICFGVLARSIKAPPSPLRLAALTLMGALLVGNAFWNLLFFRLRNLEASSIVLVVYVAVALALMIVLGLFDQVSAWVFAPYLVYLVYAIWWMLWLRRLNTAGSAEAA